MNKDELEVGKRYEIKVKEGITADVTICGVQTISWLNEKSFGIVGAGEWFSIEYYTFTRLPSFGDEIEVLDSDGNKITEAGCCYLGEDDAYFFTKGPDGRVDSWQKQYSTIRLKPQPQQRATIMVGDKNYYEDDLVKRAEGLPEAD